eukprot:7233049-Alexandrium_andersonii.AAC.1
MRTTNAQRRTHTTTHSRDRTHRADPPTQLNPSPRGGRTYAAPPPRQRPGQVRRTKLAQERPGPRHRPGPQQADPTPNRG